MPTVTAQTSIDLQIDDPNQTTRTNSTLSLSPLPNKFENELQNIDSNKNTVNNSNEILIANPSQILGHTTGHLTNLDRSKYQLNNNFNYPSKIPSFQILNPDFLLGQQYQKPNAIVRPLRRNDITSPALPSKDGSAVNNEIRQNDYNIDKRKFGSQEIDTFAKELDFKLRHLRNDSKSPSSSKNSSDTINKRPLFITTVPTGIFLPPPSTLQTRGLYAYSSRPRIYTVYRSIGYFSKLRNIKNDKKIDDNNYDENYLNDKYNSEYLKKSTISPLNSVRANNDNLYNYNLGIKYKSEPYKNIMHDKRVIRGSAYTHAPEEPQPCAHVTVKEAEIKRRQSVRTRTIQRNQRHVLGTPPLVKGRRCENVQTDRYLEELFERPPGYDQNTQTDLFLQRPPSPPYVPSKIGVDMSTEICDGDLFNFDLEVEPILETLVGHTVEQGLIEVLHEEEIADLKKQQEEFLTLREADLAEVRRLEAEESRLQAEKERRLRQDEISKELDSQLQNRVTAAKLLQGHIANIVPEVLEQLEPLTDGARKEDIEKTICPWLSEQVAEEVGSIIDSRDILTEIIKEIIKQRAVIYGNYDDREPEEGGEECLCDDEDNGEDETKENE